MGVPGAIPPKSVAGIDEVEAEAVVLLERRVATVAWNDLCSSSAGVATDPTS